MPSKGPILSGLLGFPEGDTQKFDHQETGAEVPPLSGRPLLRSFLIVKCYQSNNPAVWVSVWRFVTLYVTKPEIPAPSSAPPTPTPELISATNIRSLGIWIFHAFTVSSNQIIIALVHSRAGAYV